MIQSGSVTDTSKAWLINLGVDSSVVKFKIDTGAAVTALPSYLASRIGGLQPSKKMLRGAGNNRLGVTGEAEVSLTLKEKSVRETVYFVDGLVTPLLGKPAISKLDLIRFLDDVSLSQDWYGLHPKLFSGLGAMHSKVNIALKDDATPFAQATPRRVAAARKQPLQEELLRMEKLGVISKIEEPTDWCAPCVVVPKKSGQIRVCIDFTSLNRAVRREYHPLPTSDETLSALGNARVFSKLDANCGYWQMELHEDSQKLTTFITPFGRYYCKRLPFGISSAPEIFQREMQKVLAGLEGVVCQMDDILVYGADEQEHNARLKDVMERLSREGLTLNRDKCEFSRSSVKFLGHIVDAAGIKADPAKTEAIRDFPVPTSRKELKRFFGMINYLGKFSASIAENSGALRQLLGKDNDWHWDVRHREEFERLKECMTSTPTLAPFKLGARTMLSADASSYGLGAVVLQQNDGDWRPVAFASRSLNSAEKMYAQIEKEALAICWACEKFNYFLAGTEFLVETDHKPLVSVLGSKEVAKLPIRVQRFRLRMMAYSYSVVYTPGPKLVLADALSRSPLSSEGVCDDGQVTESRFVLALVDALPISASRLERFRCSLIAEETGQLLCRYIVEGWPRYKDLPEEVRPYFAEREFLTVIDGIIYFHDRVWVPFLEREHVLKEIHSGHQGETKCIRRATEVVWWPGMTAEIRALVKSCEKCEEFRRKPKEPLLPTPFPERAWWRLAADLLKRDGKTYLVVVDYFSRFITLHELFESSEAGAVVAKLENLFCLLGIPNTIMTDNGPLFNSQLFAEFMRKWDIVHVTSSPLFPQSNGEAERAVQTVKSLMNKNVNIQAALCAYRDTPLANGHSPAELLFGRSMNSMGILSEKKLDVNRLREVERRQRAQQAEHFNLRHRVRERSPISIGQHVAVREGSKTSNAVVVATRGREVVASRTGRLIRRNREHIARKPESQADMAKPAESRNAAQPIETPLVTNAPESVSTTPDLERSFRSSPNKQNLIASSTSREPTSTPRVTKCGRISKPPDRLDL